MLHTQHVSPLTLTDHHREVDAILQANARELADLNDQMRMIRDDIHGIDEAIRRSAMDEQKHLSELKALLEELKTIIGGTSHADSIMMQITLDD